MPRPKDSRGSNFLRAYSLITTEGKTVQECVALGVPYGTAYRAAEIARGQGKYPTLTSPPSTPLTPTPTPTFSSPATSTTRKTVTPKGQITHLTERPAWAQTMSVYPRVMAMPVPMYLEAGIKAANYKWGWDLNVKPDDFIDTVIFYYFKSKGIMLAGAGGAFYEPEDLKELLSSFEIDEKTGKTKPIISGGDENAISERPARPAISNGQGGTNGTTANPSGENTQG